MFFVLSKLFWIVARPLNLLFLLALAGLIAGRLGYARLRTVAIAVSLSLFVLVGFTRLPDYLLHRLETAVAAQPVPAEPAGIIVLGGGIVADGDGGDGFHLNDAADRLVAALRLKRLHPGARLVYSGGSGALVGGEPAEALGAAAMVRALYGDDLGMELEMRSRSTWENAVEVAAMLGEERTQPWLLVTSAFHMPRALGCFRRNGVNVVAVPADFRGERPQFPWLTGEAPNQFVKASLLVKEYVGLVAYYATGRTDALLPR